MTFPNGHHRLRHTEITTTTTTMHHLRRSMQLRAVVVVLLLLVSLTLTGAHPNDNDPSDYQQPNLKVRGVTDLFVERKSTCASLEPSHTVSQVCHDGCRPIFSHSLIHSFIHSFIHPVTNNRTHTIYIHCFLVCLVSLSQR